MRSSLISKKGTREATRARRSGCLRGAGIALRPSFVSFTPWTTIDDYIDVMDFVEAEGLIDNVDPVQYTIRLLVPPGSLLLERAGDEAVARAARSGIFHLRMGAPGPVHGRAAREGEHGWSKRREQERRPVGDVLQGPRPGPPGARRRAARRTLRRRSPGQAAPAAPYRSVVLLSGAHAGPVRSP